MPCHHPPTIYSFAGVVEPFSCLSHMLGALVVFGFTLSLLRRGRGHPGRVLALGIFAASAIVLLVASGVYHLLPLDTPGRTAAQRFDRAAIFALIAGSFTPPHIILFRGWWRWGVLLLVWGLAIVGMTFTVISVRAIPEWLSLISYLGLGWIGIISGIKVWRCYSFECIKLIFWGGLLYTLGALIDFIRRPILLPGVIEAHELFHVAVLAALACHWRYMLQIADGRLPDSNCTGSSASRTARAGR